MSNLKNLKDITYLVRFLKLVSSLDKKYLTIVAISSIVNAIKPYINIILPKFIIDELMGQKRWTNLFFFTILILVSNFVLGFISNILEHKSALAHTRIINELNIYLGNYIMDMDFENIEDPEILSLKEQALYPITNQNLLNQTLRDFVALFQITISMITGAVILIQLSPFLLLVLITIVLLSSIVYFLSQKNWEKFYKGLPAVMRKSAYYEGIAKDFNALKDYKLYNAEAVVLSYLKRSHTNVIDLFQNVLTKNGLHEALMAVFAQIQMGIVYTFITYQVLFDRITIGGFTMFVSAALSFSNNINDLIKTFISLRQSGRYLQTYFQFLSIETSHSTGSKSIDPDNFCIEFKDVSFRYPGSEQFVLRKINLVILPNEKISVVGHNGAGKSTFIKLLCGLYTPTEGKILLNGTELRDYSYQEYVNKIAAVFQDFQTFAFTIRENIAFDQSDQIQEQEICHALEAVGLFSKISSLKSGIHTTLYRYFDDDSIALSGGEMQKLAIARIIYKKQTKLLILDEPTAALDPYAEYETYKNFDKMVQGKAAIYISHRMSSCRICDRVIVFDKGEIIENGNHEELINRKGLYFNLWSTQAQYYTN